MGIAFEPISPVPPITTIFMVRLRLEDRDVGSVRPGGRYKTKDVAGDRDPADGRERQVSGHEGFARPARRPDARILLTPSVFRTYIPKGPSRRPGDLVALPGRDEHWN